MSSLTSDEIEQLAESFDDYHHEEYPKTHPSVENRLTNPSRTKIISLPAMWPT
jgi:hypothetical protein